MNRVFKFGKYKGLEIKYVILSHIGYVMWCFENISNFNLNEEEQSLYDAIAIMIQKYNIKMTFPTETMLKYVKDKDNLKALNTPFFIDNGVTSCKDLKNPIYRSVEAYKRCYDNKKELNLSHLLHVANKFLASEYNNILE